MNRGGLVTTPPQETILTSGGSLPNNRNFTRAVQLALTVN